MPARTCPPSGPTEYDNISMPASRPRIASGMVWFHTVPRNIAEIMSAEPARARKTSTSQKLGITPASAMQPPYAAAATTIARPWWCTCEVHPLSAVASMAPTVSAA
jgi:hypothetical protein